MINKNFKNRHTVIYGTIIMLAFGFLILIGLVFLFSNTVSLRWSKCVAVVPVNYELVVDGNSGSLFTPVIPSSEQFAATIKELDDRSDVGALVLVVNSPGGSVVASREIYYAVKNLSKPKVGYFREVAASGGYYISAPLDYIVSDPATLTGSIGVIVTFSDMSGLFEKVGFNMTSITSGDKKDIGSPSRSLTEEEHKLLQSVVDEIFEDFKSIVIANRGSKLNKDLFNEVLDGRILTGKQALSVGLIDALGTKDDAIAKARELAGLEEDAPVCDIEVVPGSGGGLLGIQSLFGSSNSAGIEIKFQ